MKRGIVLLTLLLSISALSACGNKSSENTAEKTTEKISEAVKETENATAKDLPDAEYEEIGNGTVYISTAGGTSENGNVPVIYSEPGTMLMQIGIDSTDFNGGSLSYIYIDGMIAAKEQLSDSQSSIDLSENHLTYGTHKIEVVQYENDDPGSKMTTYRKMAYEVKEK